MNLTTIRAALETQLLTVTGLRAYSEWPDKPEPPAVCIRPADPYIEPHQTFGPTYLTNVYFVIDVIVSLTPGSDRAQVKLDGLIGESIPDALAVDTSLGGVSQDVQWTSTSGLRSVVVAGVEYMGVAMNVTVRARHS